MTRAQERLILTTHGGSAAGRQPSRFIGGAAGGGWGRDPSGRSDRTGADEGEAPSAPSGLDVDRRGSTMAAPVDGRHRAAGRRRPPGHAAADGARATPRAAPASQRARRPDGGHEPPIPKARPPAMRSPRDSPTLGRSAATTADAGTRPGPRSAHLPVARARLGRRRQPAPGRAAAGAVQLLVADVYERCPLQYAFRYVYRMPRARIRSAAFSLRDDGPRGVRGVHPGAPRTRSRAATRRRRARTSSASSGRAGSPTAFGDKTTEEGYQRRVATLLDNFWDGRGQPPSARRCARKSDSN